MKTLKITYFSLFLVGIIAFAGCKSSSTSPNGSTAIVIPNAGSYFVSVNLQYDSTGALVESDTSVETFLQTGLSIHGKTNVVEVVDSSDGSVTDTTYYHYESNGDVSAYENNFGGSLEWATYPFGSQQSQQLSGDTTEQGISESYAFTISGAGAGSISIAGKEFTTEKITVNGKIIATIFGIPDTLSGNLGTEAFAPSLGEIVDETTPAERDLFTQALGTSSHEFLISYVLK